MERCKTHSRNVMPDLIRAFPAKTRGRDSTGSKSAMTKNCHINRYLEHS